MALYRLLLRSTTATTSRALIRPIRVISPIINQTHNSSSVFSPPFLPIYRTFAFSSAEEAAAERRRRKRRLRIEPPIPLQRNPHPPPHDPNAPRLPDSTSALVGPRLNLHNRVQSLIRAFDLDAASLLARNSVYSRIRPTVFTCNAIIAAMYRAKRYDDAVALFKYFFEQHDIIPNVVSYNNLINTHCDEGRVDTGLDVYRHIIATAPFSPSPVTYRHLTKGLIDTGRIGEAVDLLREMLNRGHGADSLVYNNVIKGFLDLGNLEKANEFFDELKERCLVYDGVVSATFMDWWFKQGKDKEAMESYKSLMDKKFRMVPATCNVLLEVLLKYGKKEAALALFEQMLDNHTPPNFQAVNSDTFNIMVNECFKEGKIDVAIDMFRKVGTKPGSKPFAMDVAGYNNIIARFCENEMLEEAENYFTELTSKSLSPDVTSFRTFIDAYMKMGRVADVLRVFGRMVDAGLRVVVDYGTRVFAGLIKNGKVVDSAVILTKMGERDPKPDPLIYDVVARGLIDAAELDTVKDIMDQMMRYAVGIPPTLKELVTETFKSAGRREEIEKVLDENRWRSFPGVSRGPRQSQIPIGPPRMSKDQLLGPSSLGGQSLSRQPQAGRLQQFDQHQMVGDAQSVSSRMFEHHSSSSHAVGQQTSWFRQSGKQDSCSTQAGGQQPFWSTQTGAQQSLWSAGKQISGSPQSEGQQVARSSQTGQEVAPSSQMGEVPPSSLTGGQQPSWPSQMSGRQPSWSSQMEGQQPPWSFKTGESSWSSQKEGWSSQTSGQQPSWSLKTGVQQSTCLSKTGGEQLRLSSQARMQNPTSSSQTEGQWLGQAGGKQPSWSPQTGEQQAPWTSLVGNESSSQTGLQSAWFSQSGGQRQSWPSQSRGEQQSWSAQIGGQLPSQTMHMANQPSRGSVETSRPEPIGSLRNSGDYSHESPSFSGHQPIEPTEMLKH